MAPVACRLAEKHGVLEPIQTANSVQGQVEELPDVLLSNATTPVVLVGFSWGAWLSVLLGSKCPELVGKIIWVSSGASGEAYVADLSSRRLSRLPEVERAEFLAAMAGLDDPDVREKDTLLSRLGRLASKADSYAPIDDAEEPRTTPLSGEIYRQVWGEAAEMRRTGALLDHARNPAGPVVAIHGDSNPSLAAGVSELLSANLADFRFVLLAKCGHTP
jgi:pimeloyl-ACP methyl ester carboxylesterase